METVFALDMDDVLFDFEPAFNTWLIRRNLLDEVRLEKLRGEALYTTTSLLGCSVEEANNLEVQFLRETKGHVIGGAVEGVKALRRLGLVHVVTARIASLHMDATLTWIDENFRGAFEDVHLTVPSPEDPGLGKGHTCREIGASILVDDHPRHLDDAVKNGIDTIQFGMKAWSSKHKHVTANSWADVVGLVQNCVNTQAAG
jgi:hypothetical protein